MMTAGVMGWLDYLVMIIFFILLLVVGFVVGKRVKNTEDFYLGGANVPWWLSGISHHVSGYSGVVFVAYAGIAYAHGTSIYFWWALNIAIAMSVGAVTIVPRWPKLRKALGVQSPTEYLAMRYSKAAQLLISVSGVITKVFDVGAKWASVGILFYGFTGFPIWVGILGAASFTLVYMTVGGLLADIVADNIQFLVQVIAGVAIFIGVVSRLGEFGHTLTSAFGALPQENIGVVNAGRGQGSLTWTLAYFFVIFFSYNGGTWNLAAKFLSNRDDKEARKSAFFSSFLYLVWPIVIFTPMWLGPLIFPGLTQAQAEANLYAQLTLEFLPHGFIGLVLSAMFAATITMCASDINVVSAAINRDILPLIRPSINELDGSDALRVARITTAVFTTATVLVGVFNQAFGGVTDLVLSWFAALLGPTAIPLILGLFKRFRYADSKAAIWSVIGGFSVFLLGRIGIGVEADLEIILPLLVSFIIYAGIALINQYVLKKEIPEDVAKLMEELN